MSALSMLSLNFFLNVATDVDDFKGLFRSFQILTDLYANERCQYLGGESNWYVTQKSIV